ncbi:PmbA/TldA family metallopeptidase [Hymenobacter rubidus]|uniref:PmbA/TldA family metallopeptidase n=1 Tax=Hymenobacter rubidus TaxID=1441626 RepID=UPI00191E26E8|nr:DNA gyrase modulator [Hymenobacter rubidus]
MKRRGFVGLSGLAAGALFLPSLPSFGGNPVGPTHLLKPGADAAQKKRFADAGLHAAKAAGASCADVRIGRSLNQCLFARAKQVQNNVSTESYGVGIRALVGGCWGFASTSVATVARVAAAIAEANKLVLKESLQLAAQQGYSEVSWKMPIQQSALRLNGRRRTFPYGLKAVNIVADKLQPGSVGLAVSCWLALRRPRLTADSQQLLANSSIKMAILSKNAAQALLKKVLTYSTADECEASLRGRTTGNIRYARNSVSTVGAQDSVPLTVESRYGKRSGIATCNGFDDKTLKRSVQQAEDIAKLASESPEYVPLLGPQTYLPTPSTAATRAQRPSP